MTELSFAKQFLTKLDSVPVKLAADNVVDPRTYPAQSAYILPRLPNPKRKRTAPPSSTSPSQPGADGAANTPVSLLKSNSDSNSGGNDTITAHIHPLKPAPHAPQLTLPPQPRSTSIYDLKALYASANGLDPAKLKLLLNKKPVGDSKSLGELLPLPSSAGSGPGNESGNSEGGSLVFGVMLMPGAVLDPAGADRMEGVQATSAAAPVAQGESGSGVLRTDAFWADLQGFLVQRIRDDAEGKRLAKLFREAYKGA